MYYLYSLGSSVKLSTCLPNYHNYLDFCLSKSSNVEQDDGKKVSHWRFSINQLLQHYIGALYVCQTDEKMEAILSHHSPGRIYFEADVVWSDYDAPQQRLQELLQVGRPIHLKTVNTVNYFIPRSTGLRVYNNLITTGYITKIIHLQRCQTS